MPASNTDPDLQTGPPDALELLQLALREQQAILDNAGVGIVFIKRRTLIRCNQRFAQVFGHASTADALRSSNMSLYPDEASFHALTEAAYPVMAQGLAYKSEVLMKRRDGELFWTHLTGKLVNPAATDEGSIWIVDDISERKAAQAQLESVLTEQSLILDNAMVGIVFLRDRRVTRCNQSFETMLGYAPGELHGVSSRQWYLTEQEWIDAAERWRAPFAAGQAFAA